MPSNPQTIIQNVAPGPPRAIANATPAMLPLPTVPETAVASAWKVSYFARARFIVDRVDHVAIDHVDF